MKKNSYLTALSMITQFGITTLTPMLLCIFAAMWLKNRFALGDWVVLAGLVLGIGSGIMSMLKMIKQMGELVKKEDDDEPAAKKTGQ